jgi:hypothetical protein
LGIREAQTGWKMSSEDASLRCQVLILEQEFLIDQAGDVGQQTSPFVVCHEDIHHKLGATRVDKLTTRDLCEFSMDRTTALNECRDKNKYRLGSAA